MSIYSGTNILICFNILTNVNILSLDILGTDSPPIIKIILISKGSVFIKSILTNFYDHRFKLRGPNCMLRYLGDRWINRMVDRRMDRHSLV